MSIRYCITCGKELEQYEGRSSGECTECNRKTMRKLFSENPDLKQAFMNSIEEMRKPENLKPMADRTTKFIQAIQTVRGRNGQ